jgi:hypothetical protein
MSEVLTSLDFLLLDKWQDTLAIWDAINELEDRLSDRFESSVDRLRPWLGERGYEVVEVDRKWASFYVAKRSWFRNREEELVSIGVGALLPYGFRRVDDEHPYVWVAIGHMEEDEQEAFNAQLTERLQRQPGGWINDRCYEDYPAGRFLMSHGDAERIALAKSEEAMESFMKTALESVMALEGDIEAALSSVGVKAGSRRAR